MMVPLGLWAGIIGYTVLYSAVIKLGGGECSLAQAFRGQCIPKAASSSSSTKQGQTAGLPTRAIAA